MADTTRTRIRKVHDLKVADFDDQLWPINVTIMILAGIVAGIVVATTDDFQDPHLLQNGWFRLSVVALLVGIMFWAVVWLQGRVRRRVLLCVLVSLVLHVWLGIALRDRYLFLKAMEEKQRAEEIARRPELVTVPDYHWEQIETPEQRQSYEEPVDTVVPDPQVSEIRPKPLEQDPPKSRQERVEPEPTEQQPRTAELRRAELSAPRRSEAAGQISRQQWQHRPAPDEPVPQPTIRPEGRDRPSALRPQVSASQRRQMPTPTYQRQVYEEPRSLESAENIQLARVTAQANPLEDVPTTPAPTRHVLQQADAVQTEAQVPQPVKTVRPPQPEDLQPSGAVAERQLRFPDSKPSSDGPASRETPLLARTAPRPEDRKRFDPAETPVPRSRPDRSLAGTSVTQPVDLPDVEAARMIENARRQEQPAAATVRNVPLGQTRSSSIAARSSRSSRPQSLPTRDLPSTAPARQERATGHQLALSTDTQPAWSGNLSRIAGDFAIPSTVTPRQEVTSSAPSRPQLDVSSAVTAAPRSAAQVRRAANKTTARMDESAEGSIPTVALAEQRRERVDRRPSANIDWPAFRIGSLGTKAGGADSSPVSPSDKMSPAQATAQIPEASSASGVEGEKPGTVLTAPGNQYDRNVSPLTGMVPRGLAAGVRIEEPSEEAIARRLTASGRERTAIDFAPAYTPARAGTEMLAAAVPEPDLSGADTSASQPTSREPVMGDQPSGRATTATQTRAVGALPRRRADHRGATPGPERDDVVAQVSRASPDGQMTRPISERSTGSRRILKSAMASGDGSSDAGNQPGAAYSMAGLPAELLTRDPVEGATSGPTASLPGTTSGPQRGPQGDDERPTLAAEVGTAPARERTAPGLPRGSEESDTPPVPAEGPTPLGEIDILARTNVGGPSRREGGLPVEVAARLGPGGLSVNPSPSVGIQSRRARPESEVVHQTPKRFVVRWSGDNLAVNGRVTDPTPAFRHRDPSRLSELVRIHGGSDSHEKAVELGLEFLSRHQYADGHWALDSVPNGDRPEYKNSGFGEMHSHTGATGLALLAFLGRAYTHVDGKHRDVVGRGIDWLLKNQQPDGSLFSASTDKTRYARSYAHGIATIALCEAYGMTQDPAFRDPARKAVQYILDAQHPTRGGWRYTPKDGEDTWRKESDTSVSGWQLMALKSAQMANLQVPQEALDKVSKWLDRAEVESGARYRYNPYASDTPEQRRGQVPNLAMTAEGLLMRLYLGWDRKHEAVTQGADHLAANLPDVGTTSSSLRDVYYWYYATQVMFHVHGDHWQTWKDAFEPLLIAGQIQSGPLAGSWDPEQPVRDRWAHAGGRHYVTTLNLLMLEVYYRHLPLFDTLRDSD